MGTLARALRVACCVAVCRKARRSVRLLCVHASCWLCSCDSAACGRQLKIYYDQDTAIQAHHASRTSGPEIAVTPINMLCLQNVSGGIQARLHVGDGAGSLVARNLCVLHCYAQLRQRLLLGCHLPSKQAL